MRSPQFWAFFDVNVFWNIHLFSSTEYGIHDLFNLIRLKKHCLFRYSFLNSNLNIQCMHSCLWISICNEFLPYICYFFLLETAFLSKYFYAGQWRNKICQYTIISWILPFEQRYFALLLDGLSLIMRWNKRYYKKRYDTIELSHVLYLLW